ncbi:N-terminal ig-like domain of cellulase [Filimonas lacunae]|uniref:N-terminal ig-like domain of cellulase n=1 Tax=Filimonas lacunae TaxID=477680 RepID=A0A173MH41_9BACT|nr:glycoside hydrolase family 9 protein [Filimonas lacunae]BAV06816.1 glycoside hydrolase, family 9 [Filimonas lacunae]SIS99327.1 N-terminal ig-like domain of cellulase [Filimonas lacunae]
MKYFTRYTGNNTGKALRILSLALALAPCYLHAQSPAPGTLQLTETGYLYKPGLNVLVFNSHYGLFGDEKLAGIELIHHEVRTATNGDVRLDATPEQWDSIPQFIRRETDKQTNTVRAWLRYPAFNFDYTIEVKPATEGVVIRVLLDKPVPAELAGRAGFNLEFLPSAYFSKTYMADGKAGVFPLYPTSNMALSNGRTAPLPLAQGNRLVLAPEDAMRRVRIESETPLLLYDGRNKAQNGWFVVRSLLPAGKTGTVLEWHITASTQAGWTRPPVIGHSQVGYHPDQPKMAAIELDKNSKALANATLLQIDDKGTIRTKYTAPVQRWGNYLRYQYYTFNFSAVKDTGLYMIQYGTTQTKPFRIDKSVYQTAWHATQDIFMPEQMDHITVKEAYRVWHGASHLDDALQAPTDRVHFDLYAQGPTTDTRFKPYEHIPGLNVGGWYDAGDFDLRTQTIYGTVTDLVHAWELFRPTRDETLVDQTIRYVELHRPDGKPDMLQQIEHGTLQLLAQFNAVGHAINGIVEAHLEEYTHLGDAVTKTDNLIYKPSLGPQETEGNFSGRTDDRWAFTNRSTALNYGSIAALAAASRALKGYNDTLAMQCLQKAVQVWEEEQTHPPYVFNHGNTTGGPLLDEKMQAALELRMATGQQKYADTLAAHFTEITQQFNRRARLCIQALPYLDASYQARVKELVTNYKQGLDKMSAQNPYGVPVTGGGWAGSGVVINFGLTNYYLHRAFPDIIGSEPVFNSLHYLYGTHPGSDISLVSAVGTESKKIAYGNNRANFTYIAGGIVPGVLIIPPDFPENKEDWPFLWGENEYVVGLGASYILLVNAVNQLLHSNTP